MSLILPLIVQAAFLQARTFRHNAAARSAIGACGDTAAVLPALGGSGDAGVVMRKLTPEMHSAAKTLWSWQASSQNGRCPHAASPGSRQPSPRWALFPSLLSDEAWGVFSGEMLLAMVSLRYELDFSYGASALEALLMGVAGKQRMRLRAVDLDPGMPDAVKGDVCAAVLMKLHALCSVRSVDLIIEPSCLAWQQ